MRKNMKKMIGLLLAIVMVMSFAACGAPEGAEIELITVADGDVIGEGSTQFPLTITDAEGTAVQITVKTDEATVGEALVALGLIAGEESEYGLYMKTVNGITLDYETDGLYWAFYIDGTYAVTGVDLTEIAAGSSYELKAEK